MNRLHVHVFADLSLSLIARKYFIQIAYYSDKELIQPITTPDQGHHMGKQNKTQENTTHTRAKIPAPSQQANTRPQGTGKAYQRLTRNINNKNDPQEKHRLGTASKLSHAKG